MRDTIDMAREVKMPYDFVTSEPINIEKLKAFEAIVRADERERIIATQPAPVPTSWMEMVTVNLLREGVNKHKARELAEHFYSLLQPAVPDAITDNSETPEYIQGWNDCRQAMLAA